MGVQHIRWQRSGIDSRAHERGDTRALHKRVKKCNIDILNESSQTVMVSRNEEAKGDAKNLSVVLLHRNVDRGGALHTRTNAGL